MASETSRNTQGYQDPPQIVSDLISASFTEFRRHPNNAVRSDNNDDSKPDINSISPMNRAVRIIVTTAEWLLLKSISHAVCCSATDREDGV